MNKCEAGDLKEISEFYHRVIKETGDIAFYARWCWGKHPTEEMLREYIRQGVLYYTEKKGIIVSAAAVTPYQTAEYHEVDWKIAVADDEVDVVHILAVDPQFHRCGMAKAMMKEIIRHARENGQKAVRLDALRSNSPAHRLYESLGFSRRGICHWYAENTGWMDFYLFEYLL